MRKLCVPHAISITSSDIFPTFNLISSLTIRNLFAPLIRCSITTRTRRAFSVYFFFLRCQLAPTRLFLWLFDNYSIRSKPLKSRVLLKYHPIRRSYRFFIGDPLIASFCLPPFSTNTRSIAFRLHRLSDFFPCAFFFPL